MSDLQFIANLIEERKEALDILRYLANKDLFGAQGYCIDCGASSGTYSRHDERCIMWRIRELLEKVDEAA